MTTEEQKIYNYLKSNEIYADVSCGHDIPGSIMVYVEDGDWKHDHICLRHLMSKLGYDQYNEVVVGDDDGDDCYSSEHYFWKL